MKNRTETNRCPLGVLQLLIHGGRRVELTLGPWPNQMEMSIRRRQAMPVEAGLSFLRPQWPTFESLKVQR